MKEHQSCRSFYLIVDEFVGRKSMVKFNIKCGQELEISRTNKLKNEVEVGKKAKCRVWLVEQLAGFLI